MSNYIDFITANPKVLHKLDSFCLGNTKTLIFQRIGPLADSLIESQCQCICTLAMSFLAWSVPTFGFGLSPCDALAWSLKNGEVFQIGCVGCPQFKASHWSRLTREIEAVKFGYFESSLFSFSHLAFVQGFIYLFLTNSFLIFLL